MQYSGILIRIAEDHLQATAEEIDSFPEVHVQYTYPESGRVIAVLETETLKEQQRTLRKVQELQHVLVAELVYHRIDEGDGADLPRTEQAGKRLKTI